MRNYGLAILGLIFVISCSEEDHRIDISYTGEQLRSVIMPVGGVETGHMLINGDGSICASDVFSTFAPDSQETSLTFFSLYAVEEGDKPVVRIMEREHFDGSAGIAGGLESSASLGGSRGSKGAENSGGSEVPGSAGDSEGIEGSGEDVQNLEAGNRFDEAVFHNAFPWVQVDLLDDEVPLQVRMAAWSPFIPLDIRNSNLPVAVFEWELTNLGKKTVSWSIALAMQNLFGLGGQNGLLSMADYSITPITVSNWKGFTFSNYEGDSSMPGKGAVRVISSAENTFFVPLIGESQKSLEQFWTDFSTDGKLELQSDIIGSSGRMKSRGDASVSSGRREKRDDDDIYSASKSGMAVLYSSGVLDPGESVTIPFLFSWYTPFGHTIERLKANAKEKEAKPLASSFDRKPSTTHSEDKPSTIHSEVKPSTYLSESKPTDSCFKGIADINGYMVSEYENLRDKTMQFSQAMITSTIAPEALETVLSGFADAVGQRDGNTKVISNPFPNKGTNEISVTDRSAWNIYHDNSGFTYNEEKQVMKFSPEADVLPVRFFWATHSGWGTINVSRARIVLDCIYGSLNLKQLLLEGRSFFVFREFVPSREANITYDNETLIINFPEKVHIPEGMSFTMEIP